MIPSEGDTEMSMISKILEATDEMIVMCDDIIDDVSKNLMDYENQVVLKEFMERKVQLMIFKPLFEDGKGYSLETLGEVMEHIREMWED
jgi:hypothetical protein